METSLSEVILDKKITEGILRGIAGEIAREIMIGIIVGLLGEKLKKNG